MVDLRFNYPVLPEQHEAFRTTLAALPASDDYLHMAPPGGFPADRQQGAAWLSRPGYPISPDQVQLGCGGHHGLAIVALAARLAGQTVAVDPLTYNGFLGLAAQFNITAVPCPGDADGMRPDALADLCRHTSVRATYLMPTMHNPLCRTMPLARREALVAVARQADLLVIDDDAYGFLEPDAPLSFAHLAPERAFFIYSLAKVLAPGVKLSYVVAPADYQAAVSAAIRSTSSGSVVLFARLVGEWMQSGELKQLISHKRTEAARRQALVQRVFGNEEVYDARPTSFHCWLPLPDGTDMAAVEQRLLAAEIEVVTSLVYRADPASLAAGLRMALGNLVDDATLEAALRTIILCLKP